MPRVSLLLVAALLAVGASEASAAFTIRTDEGWVSRVGPLVTRGGDAPTFGRATDAFGRPTDVVPVGDGGEACRVTWGTLRLRATFANFGLGRACAPNDGLLQSATIRSREFRTWKGLRVGDRSSTIKAKHPRATFRRNVWWISSVVSPYGEEATRIPTIEAIVGGGRVKILRLWIGAAGD